MKKRYAWGMILLGMLVHAASIPVQAAELEPAPEGTFSIVVIPDTQRYLGRGTKIQPDSTDDVTNEVFENHVRWISENLQRQRILFVSHVGDIVDKNNHDQWRVARKWMDVLHGQVPYGISVGNHDMTSQGDSSLFQEYFGAERFADFDWYGGTFSGDPERKNVSNNNANSYQLFSAEGLDFIFLHLECNAPDNVLEWANQVLAEHADRRAIITTHMDLGPLERPTTGEGYFTDPKGRMRWKKIHGERGNTPQQMWEKCYRHHPNLFLICSGDQSRTTALSQTDTGKHGNTVHALLSDYTSNGPLRIYRFLPAEDRIQAITWDTTRGKLVTEHRNVPGGSEQHQFSIPYEMSR
jgi:hypothetical protein